MLQRIGYRLTQLSASECAAWWGAIVATGVFVWDIIKWRSSRARLKTIVSQPTGESPSEFTVYVSNTGDLPATIESVRLRCFTRKFLLFRREIDLENSFGLSGNNGFPPLPLQPGEPWEVSVSPRMQLPQFPNSVIVPVIEVKESHRSRPYRYYPDRNRFNEYVRGRST